MSIIILILIFFLLIFINLLINKESFYQNIPKLKCGKIDNILSNESNSNLKNNMKIVNPNLPECIGICINQHTYTVENSKHIWNFKNSFLGETKTDKDTDIINTKCGQCIKNFYKGLSLIKQNGT